MYFNFSIPKSSLLLNLTIITINFKILFYCTHHNFVEKIVSANSTIRPFSHLAPQIRTPILAAIYTSQKDTTLLNIRHESDVFRNIHRKIENMGFMHPSCHFIINLLPTCYTHIYTYSIYNCPLPYVYYERRINLLNNTYDIIFCV